MAAILQHAGLIAFYAGLLLLNLLVLVGLPGGWIAFALIVVYGVATRFAQVGWGMLLVMAGIAATGEVAESLLGLVYVSRKGATRWGVLGAFIGGIAGALIGTAAIPIVGSIVFAFAGAFGGAVLLEYVSYRSLDRAMRTGFFAFMGKLMATLVKLALGLVILGLFIWKSWP